jgi:hypothetical protein
MRLIWRHTPTDGANGTSTKENGRDPSANEAFASGCFNDERMEYFIGKSGGSAPEKTGVV